MVVQPTGERSSEVIPAGRLAQRCEPLLDLQELLHELRTPLHAARMAAELLPVEADTAARLLDSALTHMHELLELASGRARPEGSCSLRVTAGEAVLLVNSDDRVEVRDLLLRDTVVRAAAAPVRQLLVILLSNALKFSAAQDRVVLELREDHGSVVLSVVDSGSGVPQTERELIFSPGRRGRSASAVEGQGLGLAIARRLAATFGGRVVLAASGPAGCRFELHVPAGYTAPHN